MLNKGELQKHPSQGGFTLIELMLVILIFSVVMGAAYTVFSSQQKTYTNQQDVAYIQQNLRAGMYYLTREVRMAGYRKDDTKHDYDKGMILNAGPGIIYFSMDISDGGPVDWDDIDCDGKVKDIGEEISYALADDNDQDGVADSAPCPLIRNDIYDVSPDGKATLMENVEAIGYAYAYDTDNDGRPQLDTNGNIIWAVDTGNNRKLDTNLDANQDGIIGDTGTLKPEIDNYNITMVRIWILVRSSVPDSRFINNNTYQVGLNQVTANDNYRRRLLSASVMCRNMGGY